MSIYRWLFSFVCLLSTPIFSVRFFYYSNHVVISYMPALPTRDTQTVTIKSMLQDVTSPRTDCFIISVKHKVTPY